jgi:NitT/TauT family transport system ATP-binding protein
MTILFVTHDIDESVNLADRVLVRSRSPATLGNTTARSSRARRQITIRSGVITRSVVLLVAACDATISLRARVDKNATSAMPVQVPT